MLSSHKVQLLVKRVIFAHKTSHPFPRSPLSSFWFWIRSGLPDRYHPWTWLSKRHLWYYPGGRTSQRQQSFHFSRWVHGFLCVFFSCLFFAPLKFQTLLWNALFVWTISESEATRRHATSGEAETDSREPLLIITPHFIYVPADARSLGGSTHERAVYLWFRNTF